MPPKDIPAEELAPAVLDEAITAPADTEVTVE